MFEFGEAIARASRAMRVPVAIARQPTKDLAEGAFMGGAPSAVRTVQHFA